MNLKKKKPTFKAVLLSCILTVFWLLHFSCSIHKATNTNGKTLEPGSISVLIDIISYADNPITLTFDTITFKGLFIKEYSIPFKETINVMKEAKQLSLEDSPIPPDSYYGMTISLAAVSEFTQGALQPLDSEALKAPLTFNTNFIINPKQPETIRIELRCTHDKEKGILHIEPLIKKDRPYKGLRGARAYVTNQGDNSILIFDRLTGAQLGQIQVGNAPRGIVITPDRSRLFVSNSGSGTITIIDTVTNKVIDTIFLGLGIEPEGMAITPDGGMIITANKGSNNISLIDTYSQRVLDHIHVGRAPTRVAIGLWGEKAYVTNSESNDITLIDLLGGKAEGEIHVQSGPTGVWVTSDNEKVFVVCRESDALLMINTQMDNKVYNTIPVSNGPIDLIMDEHSGRIYVANYWSNDVSVIIEKMEMKEASLPVGDNPNSLALDTVRGMLYVVNQGNNTVSVINTVNQKVEAIIPVGSQPWGIALD